jgi:hypothetical protein
MGKLVDILREVHQSGGTGFGFLGRAQTAARRPRPAAIVVSLKAGDVATAEAAAKNGADAILLTGWTPGTDVGALKAALAEPSKIWGVEVGTGTVEGILKVAHDAGASFVVLSPEMAAQAFFEEVENLDRVITIEPPRDDLALMLLRAQSLLPAQAAIVPFQLGARELVGLTVRDFTRLNLIVESLRFPSLVTLAEAPDAASVKTLVQLGAAGLVLPGGGSAAAVGSTVKSLREELERTPIPREERGTVLLGGLIGGAGGPVPEPPRREPEREPEREPDHE